MILNILMEILRTAKLQTDTTDGKVPKLIRYGIQNNCPAANADCKVAMFNFFSVSGLFSVCVTTKEI